MSKKAIFGLVAVVVILAVVALFAFSGSSSSDPEGRYDYSIELSDSIPGDEFDKPKDGMQYAIIHFCIANDNAKSDLTTNFMSCIFKVTYNGLVYNQSDFTAVSHPDYQLVDITKGSKATSVTIVEIPKEASVEDLTVTFDYQWDFNLPDIVRDDTLL